MIQWSEERAETLANSICQTWWVYSPLWTLGLNDSWRQRQELTQRDHVKTCNSQISLKIQSSDRSHRTRPNIISETSSSSTSASRLYHAWKLWRCFTCRHLTSYSVFLFSKRTVSWFNVHIWLRLGVMCDGHRWDQTDRNLDCNFLHLAHPFGCKRANKISAH